MAQRRHTHLGRRDLLRRAGAALATVAALPVLGWAFHRATGVARAAACALTPAQSRGPYYPVESIPARTDLLAGQPAGEPIDLQGVVQDAACRPLAGVRVEIWQTDGRGHYNHPGDAQGTALDPGFRYFGRTTTDAAGRYGFRTLHPAAYPPGARYQRPPHIHFRVVPPQGRPLVTQLYFPGDGQRAYDAIYRAIPTERRDAVEARLEPAEGGTARRATFDIVFPAG